MRIRTLQGMQVLRRVRDFLITRNIPVAIGTISQQVEELTAVINRMSSHAVEQESRFRAAKAATKSKERLMRQLTEEYMRPISRVAPSLFRNNAELRQALLMPRFRDHERLLASAYAMADRVSPFAEQFVAKGFVPDFVERLRKAADAFKESIDGRSLDVGRRAASTAGQLEELRRGRELVRLLDAMVWPRLAEEPDLAAEWASLTRFRPSSGGEPVVPVEGEVKAAA